MNSPRVVGSKGQVVIEKSIRDALGVAAGSLAVQRLVDDRVEIRFLPPEHRRSLRGVLAGKVRRRVPVGGWDAARQEAWREAATSEAHPPEPER
jgi:AbrB family looped-hinge helix DNA binding protein